MKSAWWQGGGAGAIAWPSMSGRVPLCPAGLGGLLFFPHASPTLGPLRILEFPDPFLESGVSGGRYPLVFNKDGIGLSPFDPP